jgi:hypothetical protein
MNMKIPGLFKDLQFVGQVEGDRRTYYVFQGSSAYLIVSANSRGGLNVSVVDPEAPEVIARKFAGRHVTGRMLREQARRPDLFGAGFAPLNTLYVMAACGLARKLANGRAMIFKIR